MTKFIKAEFNTSGEYLTYGQDRKFVARFKHRGPLTACSQTTQTFEDIYETYDTEYVSDCLFYEDLVCEFE